MVIKLGINGFGRIGRVIFRAGLLNANLEISAINDPAINVEYICYLIKFDSTHGKLSGCVTHTKDEIFVNDTRIKIFHEKLPTSVPWQTVGVQYVIEASGMFTSLEKASGHLNSESVKRVIVTAPSVDVPMVILGVNDDKLNADLKVISCASSTLYCLAPIVKVLEDSYGVTEGFVTSIHAMTPSLKPLDGLCLRGKHWRDYRSIHQNIIPATTGACKALGKIIPRVKDKLSGLAFRVPIVNVSVLDLTIRLSSNTSIRNIIESVETASNTDMRNIIKVSKDEAVSSDFIGENHSCILDADSSLQLKPNFFKLVCWYENEYSYACRVIDSIFFSEKHTKQPQPTVAIKSRSLKTQDSIQQTELCRKEVLCSASQDTGLKSKQKMLMLRKQISSQNTKDTKKRNELNKIWNDDREGTNSTSRQNRNSLFHSCVAITQPSREQICIKAHERLEMLKKEFSKMVNITESLLKKSCNSKTQVNDGNKTTDQEKIKSAILPAFNVDSIKKSCNEVSEIYDRAQKGNSRIFDMGGDYTSHIISKDKRTSEKNKAVFQTNVSRRANYKMHNKLILLDNTPKEKSAVKESINKNPQVKNNLVTNVNDTNIPSQDPVEHKQEQDSVAKTTPELQTFEGQCLLVDNDKIYGNLKDKAKTDNIYKKEKLNLKHRIRKTDSGFFSVIKRKSGTELICAKKESVPELLIEDERNFQQKKLSESADRSPKSIASKEGIIVLDEYKKDSFDETPMTIESEPLDQTQMTLSDADNFEDDGRPQSYRATDYSLEPILTGSDYTSKRGSPDIASMSISNVEVNKQNQDIYDKLDSISGTDSNNSFQINEKKSQVINISDLITSIEDLGRLDKICKIIEISDELSNKLFSALDHTDGIDIQNKKWSFKDLCDKIKLDEFCEKICEKSNE